MYYFKIFMQLIPFIFQAVKAAESYFSDESKSGPKKKAAVKSAVEALFDGAVEVSTGGQRETLKKLEPLVDKAIDVGVAFAFPK